MANVSEAAIGEDCAIRNGLDRDARASGCVICCGSFPNSTGDGEAAAIGCRGTAAELAAVVVHGSRGRGTDCDPAADKGD